MAFLEENVWKLVETVWVTKHITTLTECVWMDAMRDSKEIYVKQVKNKSLLITNNADDET